jgi:hypothetical protein
MQNKTVLLLLSLLLITSCATTNNRGAKVIPTHTNQTNIINGYDFGNYYALLIYVDDYTYLPKLETPKYDVQTTAKILRNRYGFKTTIVSNPKNSDELVGVLDKLSKKMTRNDNLLIYYAGHGSFEDRIREGFWQLKDAKLDSRVGWISVKSAVNNTLKLMNAKHILVVSDSCYSGAIFRKSNAKLGVNREDMRYYTQLHHKKSRNALTSGGLEPVLDSDPINPNHSIFTNGLLYALENNTKPIFSLEEKFSQIKRYIKLRADQTPQYSDIAKTGHEMGGDFIFVDRKIPINLPSPTPTSSPKIITNKSTKRRDTNNNQDKAKRLIKMGDNANQRGNISQSMLFYQKACDLRHGIGCAKLGMSYHKQHNDVKAVIFFTRACSFGVESACRAIEGYYSF